jgi:prepilin-type N-terminal cleavage/methylation domain-containing protein
MTRRGMTLIELMVALVVAGLVTLLASTTLSAARDVEARVLSASDDGDSMTQLRTLLGDAVRHAVIAESGGVRVVLQPDGRVQALQFETRGVDRPSGAGTLWTVTLRVDSAGTVLDADPVGDVRPRLRARARTVHGIRAQFMAPGESVWRATWDDATTLPAAVEVTWLARDGRHLGVPLVARTTPRGQA